MNPDWYDDPTGLPFQRYWDGIRWTESTRPMPSAPWSGINVTAPLPYLPPAPPAPSKWYQRKGVLIPAAVVAFLLVIGAIGSAIEPKNENSANPAGHTQSKPVSQPSVTPRSPAASSLSATPTLPDVKPSSSAAKPHKTRIPSGIGSFTMPNEVGQVLQDAQDDIQRVSRDPIFVSHSHDLIDDRFQILDRDWKVCTQNIPVGATVSAVGHIDFGVVKTGEGCP